MKTTLAAALMTCVALPASAAVVTGAQAYGDWRTDAPGVVRKITVADLPKTGTSPIGVAPPSVDARPAGAELKTPPGFRVSAFAKLDAPRLIRVAPNGDIFVSEGDVGRVDVLRAAAGADGAATVSTFAEGLSQPFGIAFYPPGPNPQWVYVANTDSVVRFAYSNGDLKARGAPETVIAKLTQTHSDHWTRDILFSPDGRRMFVSVGSGSNVAEEMPRKTGDEVRAWQADHALGAAWGIEVGRANVLAGDPDGKGGYAFESVMPGHYPQRVGQHVHYLVTAPGHKPLTTQLSAEGEAQLARVAKAANGTIVRAEHGETGIDTIARGLRKIMREELSEKVETVYAEEYAWPLGIAVLLLLVDALVSEAPRRRREVTQ